MNTSQKRALMLFNALILSAPGPAVFLLYKWLVSCWPELSISVYTEKNTVAVILSTFAFTMLGFLAAVMALMLGSAGSKVFTKYKRKSFLDVFFFVYYFVIFWLMITFILSVTSLTSTHGALLMGLAAASTINNLLQITVITYMIINMAKKALDEQRSEEK